MAQLLTLPLPTCLGEASLGLALLFAVGNSLLPLKQETQRRVLGGIFLLILIAFGVLMVAHIQDDFRLSTVVLHSHTHKPLLYKIAGVWGHHEGSMLLWVLLLAGVSALAPRGYALLSAVLAGYLGYLLMVCDPFLPLAEPPLTGLDLNPVLQDVSLAFHPPLLYMGQVLLGVPYVLALMQLIQPHNRHCEERVSATRQSPDLSRETRLRLRRLRRGESPRSLRSLAMTTGGEESIQWLLAAWCFLTVGLAWGSAWAYYELGWGGWWFWDPVENLALLPWLLTTAALHAWRAYTQSQTLSLTALGLSLFAFLSVIFGQVMVRAGVLTSVHAFAEDPERGWFLGVLWVLLASTSLGGLLIRGPKLISPTPTDPLARSGWSLLHILVMGLVTLTLLVGILYPILQDGLGRQIRIGAPYYQATVVPFAALLLLLMAFVPILAWRRISWKTRAPRALPVALVMGFVFFIGLTQVFPLIPLLILCGAVGVCIQSFYSLWRYRGVPLSQGMALAHGGFAILLLAMVITTTGEQEQVLRMEPGTQATLFGYTVICKGEEHQEGPNYRTQRLPIHLWEKGHHLATLLPEHRFYWAATQEHHETAIYSTLFSHFYVNIEQHVSPKVWDVRFCYRPGINGLLLGVVLMVGGGSVSLYSRRRREIDL